MDIKSRGDSQIFTSSSTTFGLHSPPLWAPWPEGRSWRGTRRRRRPTDWGRRMVDRAWEPERLVYRAWDAPERWDEMPLKDGMRPLSWGIVDERSPPEYPPHRRSRKPARLEAAVAALEADLQSPAAAAVDSRCRGSSRPAGAGQPPPPVSRGAPAPEAPCHRSPAVWCRRTSGGPARGPPRSMEF